MTFSNSTEPPHQCACVIEIPAENVKDRLRRFLNRAVAQDQRAANTILMTETHTGEIKPIDLGQNRRWWSRILGFISRTRRFFFLL